MAPVGYRFHPTEEEIICYYLKHKMNGRNSLVDDHIGEVDLYRRDPWELPVSARKKSDDRVWYYFCRLDYKHSNSKRASRETKNGFWKSTGKVRDIKAKRTNEVIGSKRTLVFQYRCPDSKKVVGTSWVIHEFHAKTTTPDQRALVLCKLKHKADDSAANLPDDEGEPIRVMGSNVENNAVLNNNQEVDAEQLQSLFDSHEAGFDFPLALQPQNLVQNFLSDEEDIDFADSLLNDYPPTPRSSSNAYVLDTSDRETYLAYGESPNLYGGHGSSRAYQRKQRAHCDDTLLMGPSSMDSTTVTRHEQINSIQSDFPSIHKAQHAPIPHSFMEQEGISAKGDQFLGGISSTASKHKAREGARQVANIDLPKKVGIESVKDRKIVQVMNAKPAVKSRSNGSAGNEKWGRFIHLETTTSSHTSTPPSVYLFNLVVGLFLFIIMLREVLIVH
ncbi:NAC domain-containing protein 4 isoform X5 [Populus trichocarpa]|uniref:NAC domain-containing protein 4 isoform X5 n=1 Tax=Populus trichocarpa TaxID=3694 RepID=UPI000D188FE5|nr:NAC domain-containing protein 4 isoform X5 [Populus trichocarpa]|eukprot:XP_024451229.1 NAC domain-containing protein 4 isoform X5 [Populus trichocarpa]